MDRVNFTQTRVLRLDDVEVPPGLAEHLAKQFNARMTESFIKGIAGDSPFGDVTTTASTQPSEPFDYDKMLEAFRAAKAAVNGLLENPPFMRLDRIFCHDMDEFITAIESWGFEVVRPSDDYPERYLGRMVHMDGIPVYERESVASGKAIGFQDPTPGNLFDGKMFIIDLTQKNGPIKEAIFKQEHEQ